jgi:chromosome segregation ATPase
VSAELVAAKTELQSLDRDLTTLKGEVIAYESTKAQLSQAKRDLLKVEADLTSATSRSETLGKQVANLRSEIQGLETESDKLKAQISAGRVTSANLSHVKDDLADTEASLAGRQKEISLAERQLAELKKEVAIKEAELNAATRDGSN